ncbi:unnamed protein product [Nezara viridula]|uniref:Uncharacterized protein n=1 Tax=Nezara viridula TaxID=85310 RepID=A0A9P0EB36_NEZVI|nr:unnamed protein product [Nezara viridula]
MSSWRLYIVRDGCNCSACSEVRDLVGHGRIRYYYRYAPYAHTARTINHVPANHHIMPPSHQHRQQIIFPQNQNEQQESDNSESDENDTQDERPQPANSESDENDTQDERPQPANSESDENDTQDERPQPANSESDENDTQDERPQPANNQLQQPGNNAYRQYLYDMIDMYSYEIARHRQFRNNLANIYNNVGMHRQYRFFRIPNYVVFGNPAIPASLVFYRLSNDRFSPDVEDQHDHDQ